MSAEINVINSHRYFCLIQGVCNSF